MGNQHGIYRRCVAGHCILISISHGVSKVVDAERVLLNIINVLIFCLFKLPRGACALSLQVLNTVSIQATFCVQLVFESLFFKQNLEKLLYIYIHRQISCSISLFIS